MVCARSSMYATYDRATFALTANNLPTINVHLVDRVCTLCREKLAHIGSIELIAE